MIILWKAFFHSLLNDNIFNSLFFITHLFILCNIWSYYRISSTDYLFLLSFGWHLFCVNKAQALKVWIAPDFEYCQLLTVNYPLMIKQHTSPKSQSPLAYHSCPFLIGATMLCKNTSFHFLFHGARPWPAEWQEVLDSIKRNLSWAQPVIPMLSPRAY